MKQHIDQIANTQTNKVERQQRNTVRNHKDTSNFNNEFTLFSRATSPVQLQ